jgi:hypothetical protein
VATSYGGKDDVWQRQWERFENGAVAVFVAEKKDYDGGGSNVWWLRNLMVEVGTFDGDILVMVV